MKLLKNWYPADLLPHSLGDTPFPLRGGRRKFAPRFLQILLSQHVDHHQIENILL